MTTSAPTDLDDPPADAPRFLRAFWRLVRWAIPEAFRFFGTYEYRIAAVYLDMVHSSLTCDLQATEDTIAIGLDDIPKVIPWNGLPGMLPNPTSGARVLVQFINGNAARPVVVAWTPSGDSGWLPVALTLDATGAITIGGNASGVSLGGSGGSAPAIAVPLQIWAGGINTALLAAGHPAAALGSSVAATKVTVQ